MAGARIRVDTTDLVAIADGDGRFRIDGIPPGQHHLRVEHPIIDTLGIALRSPTLTYGANDPKVAELATPSPEVLVERLCSAAWRARGPAALMGRVREADSGNPALGAKVSLLWYELEATNALRRVPRVREAAIGPDGTYRICGLPAELEGRVQVVRGALTSGDVAIKFGQNILALRSMSIVADEVIAPAPQRVATPAAAATDSANPSVPAVAPNRMPRTARLTGRVLNRASQPIVGARVQLEGTARAADTRGNGEFVLDSLPPGTQTVTVRKLGYAPTELAVDLSSRTTSAITLAMDDFVPVLETVRVSAQRERALDAVGFARRKRVGNGWYMDGRELSNRNAQYFSDVLRAAPGIRIQQQGGRQFITSSRDPINGCVNVWIDGTQWQQMEPGDIDDFVKPSELAAIEVYSSSTTPAEYEGQRRGSCTTVVVWTVRRLDRKK